MTNLKTGLTVKTTKKYTISDYLVDDILINSRRNTSDSTIDSPIHSINNRLWLVKHSRSKLVRGISIGYYGVYHEDELEVVTEVPTKNEDDEDEIY